MEKKFSPGISFIIATKDRPKELRRMLDSVASGTVLPDEIIIVDSSQIQDQHIQKEFATLHIRYIRHIPPSSSKQRNLGIQKASPLSKLIGFFDDDIAFQPDSLEQMMTFWKNADSDIGGAAFNMMNHPQMSSRGLKSLKLIEKLGFYSIEPGIVMSSGFQTMIGATAKTIYVQWLPSGASVFRREVFFRYGFDEWFEGYGYLEDLDFSYRLKKKYRLAVVATAQYLHLPSKSGRDDSLRFGRKEVINRIYFVRKNIELSKIKCYFALIIRMLLSFSQFLIKGEMCFFRRFIGNILGMFESLQGRIEFLLH